MRYLIHWFHWSTAGLMATSTTSLSDRSLDSLGSLLLFGQPNRNCWDTSWKGWILGTFFTIFSMRMHPPPKKKKQKKGTEPTIFWMTYSKSGVTDKKPTISQGNGFFAYWNPCGLAWGPGQIMDSICFINMSYQPTSRKLSLAHVYTLYWSSTAYMAFIGDPETSCRLQYQILIKWQLFTTFKMWKRCIHDEIESSTLDLGEFEISPTWTTWNGIKISVETTKRHISQQDPKLQELWGRLPCTSLRQIPFWYVTGFVTA